MRIHLVRGLEKIPSIHIHLMQIHSTNASEKIYILSKIGMYLLFSSTCIHIGTFCHALLNSQ